MNTIKKLSELAAYMKQAVETYSQYDYERLHRELRGRYEQQIMEAFMGRHPGWSVAEGNAACMMYLYRNWSFSRKVKENVAQLRALADDLIENYEECEEKFLTADAATETMRIADRVYSFSQRILKDQHLFIFLFQARYRKEDSFCRCMKMADGSVAADIYVSTQAVSKWENGGVPDTELLPKIADFFCVSVDSLFGRNITDYSDLQSALIKKICDTPRNERFKLVFNYCWDMEKAMMPHGHSIEKCSIEDYEKEIGTDAQHYSSIMQNDGFTRMGIANRSQYFLIVPEPKSTNDAYFKEIDYPSFFRDLSDEDFWNACVYLNKRDFQKAFTRALFINKLGINDEKAKLLTGFSNKNNLDFAKYLDLHHIPVWIRQVIVPNYTDDKDDLLNLKKFISTLSNVEKIEILPYHDLGKFKWKELGFDYPLENVRTANNDDIKRAKDILDI